MKNKWYWFSFSLDGTNQGCCNVQANNEKLAFIKLIGLDCVPKFDDVKFFEIKESELTPNKLISRKEMKNLGY